MKKYILILLFLFVKVNIADAQVSESSAIINRSIKLDSDYRVEKLEKFFASHNSPLTQHAETFVKSADNYNIDWRLVPAISGVESTFGKRIPYNSYNAYGWANGNYRFVSWEHSIDIVCKALREKYYNKGLTDISSIARRYAPPSTTWARNVKFFIEKIDPYPIDFTL